MPELANVLQSSGCNDVSVLAHCRATDATHVRGCWVLDWILGDQTAKPTKSPPATESLKRHQLLGRELHESLEVTLQLLARSEARAEEHTVPGKPHQQFARVLQLDNAVRCAVLEHLGYGLIDRLPERLQVGVDHALDYFFGSWWANDEEDARALDKSRPDRELMWSGVLTHGLLLAGLTGRWDDAAKICSWIDESIRLEYRFELNDYEYQWLYLCIASHLRAQPLSETAEMLLALKQSRPKRPRSLCAVWEAILVNDQAAFDSALKESLRHFLKSQAENAPNVNFWVALDESLMWLVAERQGLGLPKLPDKLNAALLRHQTVFPASVP